MSAVGSREAMHDWRWTDSRYVFESTLGRYLMGSILRLGVEVDMIYHVIELQRKEKKGQDRTCHQ